MWCLLLLGTLQPPTTLDVAIVGGGPCGLAAAVALGAARQHNHHDTPIAIGTFERDAFRPKGASIQISRAGWAALNAIDKPLAASIRATATPVYSVGIRSLTTGEEITPTPVRLLLRLAHLLFAWLGRVLRVRVGITKTHLWHDVRDALRARVCELHGAGAIHADHDLISLKEEEEALVLGFNVSGELREVRCRALFACDGTRSRVRELSPDAPCLLDEGKSVWRGVAPAYDCSGAATFYRDASGSSGLLFPAGRGGGTSWTVIAPVVPGRSETQDESRARLRDALPTRVDECLLNVIAESPLVIENKLVTRDWSKPWASSLLRVAYLGDAAHPLRPTGEGTALAFEDAYTIGHLARDLGGVGPELMRAYEQARLGRVRAVSDAVKAAAEGFYKPDSDAPAETPLSVAAAMRRFPMRYKRLGTVRGAREG